MALDHFVPQVHLRKFNSPTLTGERMYALRKPSLQRFQPSAADVCRIEGGNTNTYLRDERAIEEFLRTIEPKYTGSVERLSRGLINHDAVYTIGGFIAYVVTCSPTAMRLRVPQLKRILELTAKHLDRMGKMPSPPEQLGGGSLSELIESDKVGFAVDPKYPQAVGITTVMGCVAAYGNFQWEVLLNNHADQPFFSSDYPVAIEPASDKRVLHRLVPLSPTVAVRVIPNINVRPKNCDLSFKRFKYKVREIGVYEAMAINQAIVRCAESLVFYSDDAPWVSEFVRANCAFRLEPVVYDAPRGRGTCIIHSQCIVPVQSPVGSLSVK